MGRATSRPSTVVLTWPGGIPAYRVDLVACWRALIEQSGDDGGMTTFGDLAAKARTSRATVSGFFGGKSKSIGAGRRIIAALSLNFAEVATRIDPEPLRAAG